MNRLIYIFLFAAVVFTGFSCDKKLNTTPSILTAANFYQSLGQLDNALAATYDPLGNGAIYGDTYLRTLTTSNDLEMYNSGAPIIGTVPYYTNYDYSNSDIVNFWTQLYIGIERANVLLDAIAQPNTNFVAAQVQPIRGQALFLRAYYYFMLVDYFGGVPLRLHATKSPTDVNIARSSAKAVYAQIINDLDTAASILGPSRYNYRASVLGANSCGQISINTVYGMQARVYLTMAGQPLNDVARYADALAACNNVFSLKENALDTSYAQIFINEAQDIYDIKECMWEVEFYGNNTTVYKEFGYNGIRNGVPSTDPTFPGYVYPFLVATPKLYFLYENGDLRRDRTIAPYLWVGNTTSDVKVPLAAPTTFNTAYNRFPAKWRRDEEVLLPRFNNGNGTNFPILRYADVLLMAAEAYVQVNGVDATAYQYLNQVRRRGYGLNPNGGLGTTSADMVAGLSQTDFLDSLQNERGREFGFECLRTHDLKRWGILISTLQNYSAMVNGSIDPTYKASNTYLYEQNPGNNITTRNLLFPIPSSEISLNKLATQNPGW